MTVLSTWQVSSSEGLQLSSLYKIDFHEISVADHPGEVDSIVNSAILQVKRLEDSEPEKSRKQTVWSMSRVISNILGGGRGSLPPDLHREGVDKETEKISFKTVFKKRSV